MKCPKCNAEIADGSLFCTECGAKIENNANQETVRTEQNSAAKPRADAGRKKGGSNVGKIVAALAAVIVVVVIIAAVALTRKTTIDLNDYLTVTISEGYDTVGSASYSFDEDQFILDYAGEIKLTSDGETAYGAYVGSLLYPNAATFLVYEILDYSGEVSPDYDLSNGDKVTFTWNVDDETIEKYFNIKVKYSNVTETVSGLEPIEEVDVFKYVTVEYDGISPNGTAAINVTGGDYGKSDFTLSKDEGLSNGDVVTVTFNSETAENMKYSGKTPTETSMTDTAVLPTYISTLDEVSDNFATDYEELISEIYENEKNWDEEYVSLKSMNYVTDYLMTRNEIIDGEADTILYLVYEVEVDQDGMDMTYYWYVGLYDVAVYEDGSYELYTDEYAVPKRGFWTDVVTEFEYTSYSDENGLVTISYTGYQKKSELYEDLIVGSDGFSYEGTAYTTADDTVQEAAEARIVDGAQEYNGHYYAMIDGNVSWTQAKAVCEALGGHLVTITSQGEQAFVESFLEWSSWIGVYLDDNGDCCWVTGEDFNYNNWAEYAPGDGEDTNGVIILWSKEWETRGEDYISFVCEWD